VAEAETPASVARRVVAVDDNADTLQAMAVLLKRAGHDVRVASSGQEAIELAEAFQPEVVLLDIGLPGLSGYEIARRLRKGTLRTRPVLVAVTGWGQQRDRERSREAGFDLHVVKPIAHATLMAILADPERWRAAEGAA
jgi:CheY-like chemotaxis protein